MSTLKHKFDRDLSTNENLARNRITKRQILYSTYEYIRASQVAFTGNLRGVNAWLEAGAPTGARDIEGLRAIGVEVES